MKLHILYSWPCLGQQCTNEVSVHSYLTSLQRSLHAPLITSCFTAVVGFKLFLPQFRLDMNIHPSCGLSGPWGTSLLLSALVMAKAPSTFKADRMSRVVGDSPMMTRAANAEGEGQGLEFRAVVIRAICQHPCTSPHWNNDPHPLLVGSIQCGAPHLLPGATGTTPLTNRKSVLPSSSSRHPQTQCRGTAAQ